MLNIRKRFINNYYGKYIRHKDSPLFRYLKKSLSYCNQKRLEVKHSIAQVYPSIINADVDLVTVALTSQCNLRCDGCSYGREFMPKEHISLEVVKEILDSMKKMDIPYIVLYGGEPIMINSSDLIKMVEYATKLGIRSVLGTNGVMLTPELMDKLYHAGLGRIRISIYGLNEDYNKYVNKNNVFSQIEKHITYIKQNYPDIMLTLNWLLMKPTCNLESVKEISEFAKKYSTPFTVNLVHYNFPYFTNGEDEALQLYEKDLPQIKIVKEELIRLKREFPKLINASLTALNALDDWLIKKDEINIPCYRYDNIWIGANGETRICQKSAILGNINEKKLDEILYTKEHTQSTRDCFALKCTGCHVSYGKRTLLTPKSRKQYAI